MDDKPTQPPEPLPAARDKQGRWRRGSSGNARGNHQHRPRRHTAFVRELVETEREDIVKQVITQAKGGCVQSQALVFKYLGGAMPRYVRDPFNMPPAANVREAVAQIALVTSKVADGVLDLEASRALIDALKTFVACYAVAELEDKVVDVIYGEALNPIEEEE
jgi:hypothetical protein